VACCWLLKLSCFLQLSSGSGGALVFDSQTGESCCAQSSDRVYRPARGELLLSAQD
jgi:hypothetical protein